MLVCPCNAWRHEAVFQHESSVCVGKFHDKHDFIIIAKALFDHHNCLIEACSFELFSWLYVTCVTCSFLLAPCRRTPFQYKTTQWCHTSPNSFGKRPLCFFWWNPIICENFLGDCFSFYVGTCWPCVEVFKRCLPFVVKWKQIRHGIDFD